MIHFRPHLYGTHSGTEQDGFSMRSMTVKADGPLLETLAAQLGNRTQVKKWLRLRQILVNNETAERHDQLVKVGDAVQIGPVQRMPTGKSVRGLMIVHEDDSILVIDKPAGLLTISTDTVKNETAYFKATEHVRESSSDGKGRIYIVHRLDRETSGLLLFAKTKEAKEQLQENWESVEKRYLAIVEGAPREKEGTIDVHLTENKVFHVFAGPPTKWSKRAVTHYALLEDKGDRSLLEVRTETGRKHQIRVHMAEIGHPIVGDDKYGRKGTRGRLGLHASYLKIKHPKTGKTKEFCSPLPAGLAKGFARANTGAPPKKGHKTEKAVKGKTFERRS